jgi:thiol-disulfide isomerase/thioredoxin
LDKDKSTVNKDKEKRVEQPLVKCTRRGNQPEAETHSIREATRPASGKAKLVNVWATWCKACREELKDVAELQYSYREVVDYTGILLQTPTSDLCSEVGDLAPPSLRRKQYFAKGIAAVTEYFFETEPKERQEVELPVFILYGEDGKRILRLAGSIRDQENLRKLRDALENLSAEGNE